MSKLHMEFGLYNAMMFFLLLWIYLTNFFNLCKFVDEFVVFDDVVFIVLTLLMTKGDHLFPFMFVYMHTYFPQNYLFVFYCDKILLSLNLKFFISFCLSSDWALSSLISSEYFCSLRFCLCPFTFSLHSFEWINHKCWQFLNFYSSQSYARLYTRYLKFLVSQAHQKYL